jgi:hypothetical protein
MIALKPLTLTIALAALMVIGTHNPPASAETGTDGTKPTKLHAPAELAPKAGIQTLDSAPFNAVLKKHLRRGRMDFAGLHADTSATAHLKLYVAAIARMPETEPLSSWINAYNALVIDAVLDRYPLQSVKDAVGGDFKFFSEIQYTVAGQKRSLDDIENGIIRPRFEDARIHVAINCGALSCPPLQPLAFEAATLDVDLDKLAKLTVNDGHHVYMKDGTLVVNEIFKWFEPDFARDKGSLLQWIQAYSDAPEVVELTADAAIDVYPYDWSLSDRK